MTCLYFATHPAPVSILIQTPFRSSHEPVYSKPNRPNRHNRKTRRDNHYKARRTNSYGTHYDGRSTSQHRRDDSHYEYKSCPASHFRASNIVQPSRPFSMTFVTCVTVNKYNRNICRPAYRPTHHKAGGARQGWDGGKFPRRHGTSSLEEQNKLILVPSFTFGWFLTMAVATAHGLSVSLRLIPPHSTATKPSLVGDRRSSSSAVSSITSYDRIPLRRTGVHNGME